VDKKAINDMLKEIHQKINTGYVGEQELQVCNEDDTMTVEVSIFRNGYLESTTSGNGIISALTTDDGGAPATVVIGGALSIHEMAILMLLLMDTLNNDVVPSLMEEEGE